MIELSNVSKIYGSGDSAVHALQNVNLTIPKGTIHGVIGLSGAGKSTLLKIMAGIDTDILGEARPQTDIKIDTGHDLEKGGLTCPIEA